MLVTVNEADAALKPQEQRQPPLQLQAMEIELPRARLSRILCALDKFKYELKNTETSKQRTSKVIFGLNELFKYYTDKHNTEISKKKQSLITRYLGGNRQKREQEIDENASFVSTIDFEGITDEVNEINTERIASGSGCVVAGEDSGVTLGGGAAGWPT
ncbi:hypothetical protein Pcinc_009946 [Petrolisthes cinctipes]|uniref:Uncharacterized protein n=1 Tax=Petrolisthes cinctipes TaxID=88211 RepID=A0AAE1F7M9_PETCI|nr:hypothetical protein Pcinc_025906 [Petrolisthes cinctipes]KAK3885885.1 hypothetical protein Pcinc_009946 [Petrolisthes cinctipes]